MGRDDDDFKGELSLLKVLHSGEEDGCKIELSLLVVVHSGGDSDGLYVELSLLVVLHRGQRKLDLTSVFLTLSCHNCFRM